MVTNDDIFTATPVRIMAIHQQISMRKNIYAGGDMVSELSAYWFIFIRRTRGPSSIRNYYLHRINKHSVEATL